MEDIKREKAEKEAENIVTLFEKGIRKKCGCRL